ncbi:50S ribosomal protein L4 [Anabaena sp. FACHB-709]|uniref:Large ribosomal subunit protein uL4 n=3 Tax=Nostocaceae TaxID=1162 RepID=RL4_NOSS1|nr:MULTISPECIES: 50S ribosomal protein L4 [Nostocaceae]Q8YPI0.1 RecName: Full=Large ribosomal subunit protein uL4; AltName: Full=50S ribosomal protein L4 [Nostoc sp. PCC 7120 = FACHB-418]BAY69836.1 50S ribosomal protein L4 [Trichormus variabilis NIES-23]HBW33219.1 50S ribosomal protein L4 [Nostoc sp. UBA8866]MBD2172793.1 50S ribosomal protein L4 [Anabaena cylindrica FACHB-318]MBD2264582.1 50S ribosomal protein L4 [Anabaena sp. FACHB-709]MBD2273722.1 50S ribosomal protein L4 [Nostoc sp. PCC 71
MVESVVKNWQGEQIGQKTFELRVAKETTAAHIVHRALVRQQTNARQGTASTKTRAEVRGGGRKPWRQKGTGRARAGSIRSPLWRGGGVIFGPKPRDFDLKMNRKERRLALRTAFVSRIDDLILVEEFSNELSRPKTKDLVAAFTRWGAEPESKILLILSEFPENVYLSARNIENLKLIAADQLNVYDLLHADKIVVTTSALEKIQEVYNG